MAFIMLRMATWETRLCFSLFLRQLLEKGWILYKEENFFTLSETARASKVEIEVLGAVILGAKLKIGFLFSDTLYLNVLFPSCLLFL